MLWLGEKLCEIAFPLGKLQMTIEYFVSLPSRQHIFCYLQCSMELYGHHDTDKQFESLLVLLHYINKTIKANICSLHYHQNIYYSKKTKFLIALIWYSTYNLQIRFSIKSQYSPFLYTLKYFFFQICKHHHPFKKCFYILQLHETSNKFSLETQNAVDFCWKYKFHDLIF